MNDVIKNEAAENLTKAAQALAEAHKEETKHLEDVPMDSAKGKEVIDGLLKSLPPEAAKKLQDALNSPTPPHVHIDEQQNVFIGEAADQAVEMRSNKAPQKKVSLIDQKRIAALQERVRRWMNAHQGKSEQEAMQAIQREDYERLPDGEKIKRLEAMVGGALQQFGQDLMNVRHNQYAIADAFDVNYRAIAKMLTKLGLPLEDHAKFMKEAHEEFEAERKAAMEKQMAEQNSKMAAAKAAQEQKAMNAEAKEVSKAGGEAQGSDLPKDATVFGG